MKKLIINLGSRRIAMLRATSLAAMAMLGIFSIEGSTFGGTASQAQNATTVPQKYEYEVVSVKPCKSDSAGGYTWPTPSGYTAKCTLLLILIDYAFGIHYNEQLSGAPAWISSERFNV